MVETLDCALRDQLLTDSEMVLSKSVTLPEDKTIKHIYFTLRKKFLQLILISFDSASWKLHRYSHPVGGPMISPKVDTWSWESNSAPQDCEVDVLPHGQGRYVAMGESNTVVRACTLYRYLQQYCSHPLIG